MSAAPPPRSVEVADRVVATLFRRAEEIARLSLVPCGRGRDWTPVLDRVLASRLGAFPVMLAGLAAVLWVTVVGANHPSAVLAAVFSTVETWLDGAFASAGAPAWLHGVLVQGVYRTVAWVVSVMLPPMAIFFPCFALLEDLGYLPWVAFNLDALFKRVGACGKQALTMSMGLGCNAAGVIACRIIDSPRERLVAVLTNSFTVCNGRFPTLIALATILTARYGLPGVGSGLAATLVVVGVVLTGVSVTFGVSWLLTRTLLRGAPSFSVLELPPFRWPRVVQVLVRSALDRTLFVLARAVKVAAPAGALVWVLANVHVGGLSLVGRLAGWLDPVGRLVGLDGFILVAFILGLPANEIVLPLLLMGYLSAGTMVRPDSLGALGAILAANGWGPATAVCFMLFSLLHWPCATTLLTVRAETKSAFWTAAAALIPTLVAFVVCGAVAGVARLAGV